VGHKQVAIIGAGAMGSGIAQVLAAASVKVVLIDVAMDLVEKAIDRIGKRLASDIKKGKIDADEKERILGHIAGSSSQEGASDADLVLEAIVEDRRIKEEMFRALDRICPPTTVFATNTSTLSVTDLGAISGRPARFLGLHFFNPAHIMKLVEVVPGLDTDKDVVEGATALMKKIGKIPINVKDCPGFLVNRVLLTYTGEAFVCAQEGISPEEIDGKAKEAGFPMGPLELADMVGLDVAMHTALILHKAYGDRFPSPEILKKLNDAGRLGMKTGKGIYCEGKTDDEFTAIVSGIGQRKYVGEFSVERLILRQVNEAIYCLQEGVTSAQDVDRAMVLGTGFPNGAGIGGPLHWADEKGLDWVLARLEELTVREGTRFWPHHLLKNYVAAGRLGKKTGKGFFSY
jgi:3-hydroxyacyl-CoA dehydrogenase